MEDPSNSLFDLAKLLGASGIGAAAFALFGRFTLRKFAEEGAATQGAAGMADIIENLRAEVKRLAEVNKSLAAHVNELQQQVVELTTKNAELQTELVEVNHQLRLLRSEKRKG